VFGPAEEALVDASVNLCNEATHSEWTSGSAEAKHASSQHVIVVQVCDPESILHAGVLHRNGKTRWKAGAGQSVRPRTQ
jgi:hypothetical protein